MRTVQSWAVRSLLATQGVLHPRIFAALVGFAWPFIRDKDGFIAFQCGSISMRLDLREDAERNIFLGRYDAPLIAFLAKTCRRGDSVMDIGANAGAISVAAANIVGSEGMVWAIEPNPVLVDRLLRLASDNPLHNVAVLNCAVGDLDGSAPFYVSSSHPFSSLDRAYLPSYPIKAVVQVTTRSLDSIWRSLGEKQVRLIKIDAQGYENRILRSAGAMLAQSPPDIIVIEAVTAGLADTLDLLQGAGYLGYVLGLAGNLIPLNVRELPEGGENVVLVRDHVPTETQ